MRYAAGRGRSEMRQDALPNDGPIEFTAHPWNPRVESWDDFKRAVERGYAQYLSGGRRAIIADPPGHAPAPPAPDPDGAS